MLKIAFIINSLSGGGAENVVVRLSEKMVKFGNKVDIYIARDLHKYKINDNINIYFLKGKNNNEKARSLKKMIIENESGGIYNLKIAFLSTSHEISKLSKIKDIYYNIRNYESQRIRGQGYFKYLKTKKKFKKIYKNEKVIGCCQAVIDDLKNNIGAKPLSSKVIYNPYDVKKIIERSSSPLKLDHPKNYILHVGSFRNKQKRQDIALKIVKQLPENVALVFLGEGKLKSQYQKMAQKLHIAHRVHFIGWTDNPFPWMKAAKLLLVTSDFEGFPNVIVESLILGTPVISRKNNSGASEILTGELNQYLCSNEKIITNMTKKAKNILSKTPSNIIENVDGIINNLTIERIVHEYLELAIDPR